MRVAPRATTLEATLGGSAGVCSACTCALLLLSLRSGDVALRKAPAGETLPTGLRLSRLGLGLRWRVVWII